MSLFGTDGIRGVANREPMTSETITRLGRALAFVARKSSTHPTILIGKDTRLSGYMIETALASGICSMGVDVFLVGPLPTSGISWLTQKKRVTRGVAITASHNSYRDNGIKIFNEKGQKISKEEEELLSRLVLERHLDSLRPIEDNVGKATRVDAAVDRYTDYLAEAFPSILDLKGMTIVVDCAHGASYQVAPRVFDRLGARVIPLGIFPSGTNINEGCGSEHPELLRETVLGVKADLGVAFDGDADRCVVVDDEGCLLDGDHLMALLASAFLKKDQLKKKTVVLTEMSNSALIHFLKAEGIQTKKVSIGDQNVSAALYEEGLSMGGEQSGHILFSDCSATVDGVLTALQVIAVVRETGIPLHQLAHLFKPWPQLLKNIPVREKVPLENFPSLLATVERLQNDFQGTGRILLRYSGTEPKLRIMIESKNPEKMEGALQVLEKEIQKTIFQA